MVVRVRRTCDEQEKKNEKPTSASSTSPPNGEKKKKKRKGSKATELTSRHSSDEIPRRRPNGRHSDLAEMLVPPDSERVDQRSKGSDGNPVLLLLGRPKFSTDASGRAGERVSGDVPDLRRKKEERYRRDQREKGKGRGREREKRKKRRRKTSSPCTEIQKGKSSRREKKRRGKVSSMSGRREERTRREEGLELEVEEELTSESVPRG